MDYLTKDDIELLLVQSTPEYIDDLYAYFLSVQDYDVLPAFIGYLSNGRIWEDILKGAPARAVRQIMEENPYISVSDLERIYDLAVRLGRLDSAVYIAAALDQAQQEVWDIY